jgi:hypothetical protein
MGLGSFLVPVIAVDLKYATPPCEIKVWDELIPQIKELDELVQKKSKYAVDV